MNKQKGVGVHEEIEKQIKKAFLLREFMVVNQLQAAMADAIFPEAVELYQNDRHFRDLVDGLTFGIMRIIKEMVVDMKWRDVKTDPPKHGQSVLIKAGEFVTAAIADLQFYKGGFHNAIKSQPGKIWWDCHGISANDWDWDFDQDEITHWAELPV